MASLWNRSLVILQDAREPGRLREAGLRRDRQAPRWRLPARLHAQAASLNGATGDRTAWVQGSLRGPYSDVPLSIPRMSAAASAPTLRLAEVSPSCALIAFNSRMFLSPTIVPERSTTLGYTLCGYVGWEWGYANFRERRKGEVCRIPLLGTSVNRAEKKGRSLE